MNPQTPNPQLLFCSGCLYQGLVVTVHTHWKCTGGRIEKALQRTKSRVKKNQRAVGEPGHSRSLRRA